MLQHFVVILQLKPLLLHSYYQLATTNPLLPTPLTANTPTTNPLTIDTTNKALAVTLYQT
jgi:hypothetical protein